MMDKTIIQSTLIGICVSGWLAGCGTMGNSLNPGIEPDAVIARLDPAIDVSPYLATGSTLSATVTAGSTVSADACNGLAGKLNPNVKIEEFGRLAVYAQCAALYEAGADRNSLAQNPWFLRLAQQSIRLIRDSCEAHFDRLEHRRVRVQYHQNNINVGVGAVTAVLAAFGSHTRAIFNLAAATTAGNAMAENYKTSFLMTPELAKLHDKIKTELFDPKDIEIIGKISASGYQTHSELVSDLAEFEDLCSHKKLVQLVSKAIDLAKFEFVGPGLSPQSLAEGEMIKRDLKNAGVKANADESDFRNLAALADLENDGARKKVIDYLDAKNEAKTSNAKLIDDAQGAGPNVMTLLENAKALKLADAAGASNVRKLNRLADSQKWSDSDDLNLRKARLQNLYLSASAKPDTPSAVPATPAKQAASGDQKRAGVSALKTPQTTARRPAPAPAAVESANPASITAAHASAGSALSKKPATSSTQSSRKVGFKTAVVPNSEAQR